MCGLLTVSEAIELVEAVNSEHLLLDSATSSTSDACDDELVTTIGGIDMGNAISSLWLTMLIGNCSVAVALVSSDRRPLCVAAYSNGMALAVACVCFAREFGDLIGHPPKSTTSTDVSSIRMRGVSDFLRSTRYA